MSRRLLVGASIGLVALAFCTPALATEFGWNSLTYGNCCSGATLDGTRADVVVSGIAPGSAECITFSSVVESQDSNRQLQAGLAKCGVNANIGGTCSLSNNFVKVVEKIPASGSPTCYPHGAASLNTSTRLTVWDSVGLGTYYAYIAGTQYESQSGYTDFVFINEWGEYTGNSCSGWSGQADFNTWQRYYVTVGTWSTVQSASRLQECWAVGSVSNGNFSVGH